MALPLTRSEAISQCAPRYFTGKPCVNGHVSERYAIGSCVACQQEHAKYSSDKRAASREVRRESIRAKDRKYWAANKDAIAKRRRVSYADSPGKAKARAREWYSKNTTRAADSAKAWTLKNPSVVREAKHKYKVKRRSVCSLGTSELDVFAAREASELASLRERKTGGKWHVDHMVPLMARTACGLHVAANLAVVPERVNLRKQNKMVFIAPGDWLQAF